MSKYIEINDELYLLDKILRIFREDEKGDKLPFRIVYSTEIHSYSKYSACYIRESFSTKTERDHRYFDLRRLLK